MAQNYWGYPSEQNASLWIDGITGSQYANGVEDTGERITDNWIDYAGFLPCSNLQIDDNFNYFYFRSAYFGDAVRVVKIPVLGWTKDSNGNDWAPIYPDLQAIDATTFGNFPADCVNAMSNNECNNQMFTFGADGSVYANLNLYMGTWSDMGDCREVKWDANGNFCWEVGQLNAGAWQASTAYSVGQVVYPTVLNTYAYECTAAGTSGTSQPTWPTTVGNTVGDGGVTWTCFATAYFAATHTCNPGQIWSAFRNGSGVTHGCTVVTDLNGGYAGSGTVYAYCWDANGLWVGNPFETDNCDSTNCPINRYTLSSEDENGSMYTDPTTGNIYYFGGQESELRVYQITGWNSGSSPWTYLGGFVTGSSICLLAPTFSPTASNYHSAQTVTISRRLPAKPVSATPPMAPPRALLLAPSTATR